MKWILTGLMALMLAGCGWNTDVIAYREVSVAPVVQTTTILDDGYYGNFDYYRASFVNYDYNYDYYYDDSPIDVTTTTIEVY